MIYGLFFSAGNQTRFGSNVPKALAQIGNKTLLDYNIKNIAPFVGKYYVVCSHNNSNYFDDYNKIVIDSGKGCGDAVMQALLKLKPKDNDYCYIQWGDAFVSKEVYYIMKYDYDAVSIPCNVEKNPYVQILPYMNTAKVKFSKYEKTDNVGLHDQSVFFAPANYVLQQLVDFSKKITYNGQYKTNRNNEMLFLDLFNIMNTNAIVIPNKEKCFSFNTLAELQNIRTR